MQLTICHLYPDVMNLYGDRGNLMALERRARWRDIEVKSFPVFVGQSAPVGEVDIIVLGGGEDRAQQAVSQDLFRKKGVLEDAVAEGAVILAICGGYQLLGHSYRALDGQQLPGLGLLDVVTVARNTRLIGNVVLRTHLHGQTRSLVGFENHAGRTWLGRAVEPLGTVLSGHGNNGEDSVEGAHAGRIFGTYLHGALLPKNPWFADHLLSLALQRRHGDVELSPLDDDLECRAHAAVKDRVLGKQRRSRGNVAP